MPGVRLRMKMYISVINKFTAQLRLILDVWWYMLYVFSGRTADSQLRAMLDNRLISCGYAAIFIPRPTNLEGVYWIHLVRPSVRLSVRPSVCRRHGFRSISQVCFGISISNFICMLMVAIGRSLLIFSDVTFKMAAWRPYWIFYFGFEYQLQTSVAKYLCIWVRAYWFSVTSFSKWLPGGHIRFFGFWMAWFRQHNSSLL